MEAYREEALRVKQVAERRFAEKDFASARSYALKARSLSPDLEGLAQMIATFEVYLASQCRSGGGQIDYYAVLGLKPSAGKRDVKKQYKKMAVLLHPDKNKCIGADGAFHLVSEAWKFLSNEFNKSTFYYKRKKHIESSTVVQKHRAEYAPGTAAFDRFPPSSSSERLDTFWTVCTSCKVQYEYLRKYVNKRLSCKNCRGAFIAVETGPAPVSAPFHYTHPSHAPPPLHSNGYSSHSYDARMPTNSTYLLGHHYPSQGHGYEYGSYDWSSSYPETASPGNLDLKRVSSVSNGYPYKHSKSVATTGIINKVKDGSNGTSSVKTKPDGLIYANPPGLSTHTAAVKVGRPEKKSRVFIEASVNGFVENPLMRSAPVSKTANAEFKLHGQSYGSTRRWSAASVLDTRKPLLQKARADIKQRLDSIRLASEAAAAAAATAAVEEDTRPVDSCKLGDVTAGRKTSGPITVPDSDFHDFDKNRSEECFEPRQIWAIYDEDDGMPRLYCVVREVLSLEPFKIDIAYLSSKTDIEFGSMKWVQYGFTKSCGHFRIQNYDVVEQVNIFSHLLRGRKTGRGGCVRIFPKTGDIWAVYKNWSLNWNESTPDEVRHEYEMVEILDEYTEQYGVCIAPLVKLEGYKTVYHRSGKEDGKKWIPRSEMLRFSHQVPSWFLKGATSGFPGNCWDLDPAAIPEELLHVGAEA
ncbi:hypothetical protein BRARA_C04039 [Brassica rapa]|uniref:J domain-containing protein n=2 Tax=Brassica TaxID=3705 RepID=A0A398AA28_BRACM|nr:uncharacterized protein LOC103860331 [Brassica rapa]XP_009136169.1 uncharacterized protein LOC103860331 [Brassica rapa]XP_013736759.2 uncharacterized protein LOC106439792 [Brassica napus]RID72133.1 hypothetical protein BRARA_C04039 [Brassica rapa]CAF2128861.1 unnamed protein product [Brassica napus]CAG7883148.1 unnamed protein product [Brassica rapa]VDC82375.1 unnamed protein product [Brassica rapa]